MMYSVFFVMTSLFTSFNIMTSNGMTSFWLDTASEMRLYVPDTANKLSCKSTQLESSLELFRSPLYNSHKPSMIIAHGWFQSAEDEVIVQLIDAIFEMRFYEKMNIFVLHMPYFLDSIINNLAYFYPAKNVERAGTMVAGILNRAMEEGLVKPEDLNLVGLSLGAHLCGYIGSALNSQAYSIVGLDPAGPGFDSNLQPWTKLQHISKTDARFVHLYHTNSAAFGTNQRVGTADFIFNEGPSQPGCATSLDPKCSHKRAFALFENVIRGDNNLLALQCDSLAAFKHCHCREHATVLLQYPINISAEGTYFLKTNFEAPYGLGNEGITCWSDQWDELQKTIEYEQQKAYSALVELSEKISRNTELLKMKESLLAALA